LNRGLEPAGLVAPLVRDSSPAVRREAALALRFSKSPTAPDQWATLASQHDGQDRWALEALGIGADLNWNACLGAYLKLVPNPETTAAGRDILWRSRATESAAHLAKIIRSDAIPEAEKDRFMRAFDSPPLKRTKPSKAC
jgi:hypothetical protein